MSRLMIAVFLFSFALSLSAETTFTYQGRLDSSGQPHGGTVGMDFRLYANPTGGSPLATDLGNSVQVTDGLFQVELDFGDQPFDEGLWLDITVNGAGLTPRQPIHGAPFANRAQSARSAQALEGDCPSPTGAPDDEMIRVGGVCIDIYEASIWDAPVGGNQIIASSADDYGCNENGQDCDNIYARSVEGVEPARNITWFQAQAALANSGKRLLSNAEWQMAVRGTPDDTGPGTTPCNTRNTVPGVAATGASGCVSDFGLHDMVGNLWEWVADWVPRSTDCPGWGGFSDDTMCLSGASTTATGPGALIRGGNWFHGTRAGPLAVRGVNQPSNSNDIIGFRGAR